MNAASQQPTTAPATLAIWRHAPSAESAQKGTLSVTTQEATSPRLDNPPGKCQMHDAPYPNVKTATDVVLRTAADEDIAFIQGVFFETQRWIIEALFGWRGDDIEIAKFLDSYDSSSAFRRCNA